MNKCVTVFHTLQLSSRGVRHLGCCACNILFLMSIKTLPSYTYVNTDLANGLLETWIQLLDDLWLPSGLLSRCTLVYIHCMSRWAVWIPVPWGAWAPWTETEKPRKCWFLKEEMTAHIIFQTRKPSMFLGHQFARMDALFMDFRKSSSSGLRPVITHDRFLFLHSTDVSQKISS